MQGILNVILRPGCVATPRRLTDVASWHEHIPFAMNLVQVLAPRVFVELGTHRGDSYCAFCQGVAEGGLETQCRAVDTWRGDPQAGEYGPEILEELRAYHDPLYGRFSRLLQSTFDQALSAFADGSVDLLHIDGLHTYEAVRHDFESWLPKMSPAGVVLMHDTAVRTPDFGVHLLWDEVKQRYPHFSFAHGNGLGVLSVGSAPPAGLKPLLGARHDEAEQVRAFFSSLGGRLTLQRQLEEVTRERRLLAERAERAERGVAELRVNQNALEERAHSLEEHVSSLEEHVSSLEAHARSLEERSRSLDKRREDLAASLAQIQGSVAWKAVRLYWRMRDVLLKPGTARRRAFDVCTRLLKRLAGHRTPAPPQPAAAAAAAAAGKGEAPAPTGYTAWLKNHVPDAAGLRRLRQRSESLRRRPHLSLLVVAGDARERALRTTLESVERQVYDCWELSVAVDASTPPAAVAVVAELAARDHRIRECRVEAGVGVSGMLSAALAASQGEFVATLEAGDALAPHALFEVANRLERIPDLDLLYTDEDLVDPGGERRDPFFKPDWSPDLLLSMNYVGHLTVIRRTVLEAAGGFGSGEERNAEYDLLLRLTERTSRIDHLPDVLYHAAARSPAGADTDTAAQRALQAALSRRGVEAEAQVLAPGRYRVRYAIRGAPLVSIIMPTKNKAKVLETCVSSIESRTTYRNYELVVVDNGSDEPDARSYLSRVGQRHQILRYDQPFNWSALNNFAVDRTRGELLLFLNNDMEVIEPGWLDALVEHAQRPEVGAVGARLHFPNDTIQHAGVVLGIGVASHAFKHLPAGDGGYFSLASVVRNYSAVTGACMMVRRGVFKEAGGFDEKLRIAFNDIDFCLRLREKGYLVVYTPHALLYHYESATRGSLHPLEDDRLMRDRWAHLLSRDPYYNVNLTRERENFEVAARASA